MRDFDKIRSFKMMIFLKTRRLQVYKLYQVIIQDGLEF